MKMLKEIKKMKMQKNFNEKIIKYENKKGATKLSTSTLLALSKAKESPKNSYMRSFIYICLNSLSRKLLIDLRVLG